MHFVIMGCGRVGSTLALSLEEQGHDVAVIDRDPTSFRRLGPEFDGRRVTGVGFERPVLEQAGIKQAYAFAAVSSGDNSNILAARVARETYGVEHVVARIYDPGRAEIYQRLGIPTVGTVRWTADRMLQRILPASAVPQFTDPSGKVVIAEVTPHPSWIGQSVSALNRAMGAKIAYLLRLGTGMIPTADTIVQENDLINVLTTAEHLAQVEEILMAPRTGQ